VPSTDRTSSAAQDRKSGVRLISEERRRQRSRRPGGEAYSLGHDDDHDKGEIARAAAVYAMPPEFRARNLDLVAVLTPPYWYLKLDKGDRIRELTKAGALIAAEIDRLQRAES
jgi:hypothetical protein